MSFVTIIEMTSKPDAVEQLRALLRPQETTALPGNEGVEVTVDAANANRLVLIAHWATEEATQAYLASIKDAGAGLYELIDGGRGGMSLSTLEVVEKPRSRRSKTRDEALEDLEEWSKRWLTLRAQIRELADQKLSAEHLGPVIKLHNEELDSIMAELTSAE